jgi:2-C-methyl-D-erythritol 4-phosphate cytidylyltransferase
MSGSSSSGSSPDRAARGAAVIVAGGAGTRMGAGVAKQYVELLGAPVLLWSVRTFLAHPGIGEVVVVIPMPGANEPPGWLAELPVTIVAGGAERADSVRAGLAACTAVDGPVLIHDAARPLVSGAVISRVLEAIGDGAAIAAIPVADTVKAADARGRVTRTVDRTGLWLAQTPQGFALARIREVHARAAQDGVSTTDDAGLFERYGLPVRLVEGAPENLKITRLADLTVAAALARMMPETHPLPAPVNPSFSE